jgi:hypothetical protein
MDKEGSNNKYVYELLPGQDPHGRHILSVIAKRTYRIEKDKICQASNQQLPLFVSDEFFDDGNPATTSPKFESDFIPYKPLTDVVLIGNAYAPNNKQVRVLEVCLSIGKHSKKVLVIGNRTCRYRTIGGISFSDPDPFSSMQLRYENAYGGVDALSQKGNPLVYPRNPIGKGFVIKYCRESIDGLQLPNLEDPNDILSPDRLVVGKIENWHKQPLPAGFGFFGKGWYPRCSFAGIMPAYIPLYETIQEASLGYVPKEQIEGFRKLKLPLIDFRFFNGASLGLSLPYLKGNEVVRLEGLDKDGIFEFQLPDERPFIRVDLGWGFQEPEVVLHTVCILKEENLVYLVWRGAIEYPGPDHFHELKELRVEVM